VVPDVETTRTVEGDLGLRENAESLVEEAIRSGYTEPGEDRALRQAAATRTANRTFLPVTRAEAEQEGRLAVLAAAMALSRHAGTLRIRLSPAGATIRHTGRDLRSATCLVATGGVFEAAADPVAIVEAALAAARRRRALVPDDVPTFVDRQHVLAAAGLLDDKHPSLAAVVLQRAFTAGGLERVG
jgi:uncharacterized protein (TIGR01319 family)